MKMRASIIILLIVVCFKETKGGGNRETNEYLGKVNTNRSLFELSAADLAMLDELNTIRSLIAQGYFNDPLKHLLEFAFFGVQATLVAIKDNVVMVAKAAGQALKEIGKEIFTEMNRIWDWGADLVNSKETLNNLAESASRAVDSVKDAGKKVASTLTNWIGKRKRRKRFFETVAPILSTLKEIVGAFKKPANIFGPATNMNMLTWNRRLAQLAMVEKKNIEKKKMVTIMYEGKLYRINKYGTLATYIIASTLGKHIASIFQTIRIGYLAVKLWLVKFNIPNQREGETINETHEMLFADREEVGCFYTWPDTLCIIGPLKATVGMLYKNGTTCEDCKYGCTNHLCNPSPDYFYAMREKYKKHLAPKIEKFEIVEGFDGEKPIVGNNFMIDSANYSNILMISILMVSFFHLLRNKV